ncbi:Do family serine endopeptidase [soil metagenome]
MKRFGSLLVAAILGSAVTLFSSQWFNQTTTNDEGARIEHMASTPSSQVAYTVNENGEAIPLDFTGVAEKVTKAVVHIKSTSSGQVGSGNDEESTDPFQYFFNPRRQQRGPSQSSGSGVIINANGYIVTNNHVVQDADLLEVTLSDDQTFKAEVVGTDPDTDIAVIKINQNALPYLSFVNSDNSKVGEWVLAVGNPFNLNSTVTAGIISAKGRNIGIVGSNATPDRAGRTAIESFIQTDAAINPGNSGGALVNLQGGLLGINTAIASPTGSYSGYGFAVPSNIVSKIVEDLLAYGTVQRGWLGIQVQDVKSLEQKAELAVKDGAFVNGFTETLTAKSAAKEAGIEKGDIIIMLDQTKIRTSSGLIEYIGLKHPGDKVNVVVNRNGKEKSFTVVLKNREGSIGNVKREEKDPVAALGIKLEDIDSKILKGLELTNGVKVKIENGKVARYTDMRDGFIVTHMNDRTVKTAKEVNELLKSKKSGDLITFSGVYEDYPREYIYAVRI